MNSFLEQVERLWQSYDFASGQRCTSCVMNQTVQEIQFDADGVCNFCHEYRDRYSKSVGRLRDELRTDVLRQTVERIKLDGAGKKYDCVIGVSGGVDSSWLLVQAIELGLRPLAVHLDNGWDSNIAQENIRVLVESMGVDYVAHVIDWELFRGLMEAFFSAGVVDIEILTDHAIFATLYRKAKESGVNYILSGDNVASEGVRMPDGWNWYKGDKRHIVAVAKRFGAPLADFPLLSTLRRYEMRAIHRIRKVKLLNLIGYNKKEAHLELQTRFGYHPIPVKHGESFFTSFYQRFLLPYRFGIDKRLPHFSALILSGEMSRPEAIKGLALNPYSTSLELARDIRFFLAKMEWELEGLILYLEGENHPHTEYPNEKFVVDVGNSLLRALRGSRRTIV